MIDGERTTAPMIGNVLVSQVLGELDAEEQSALEQRMVQNPALRDELEEIRRHLALHQQVRKVAPRRGSFERLHARMKREGAFDGAVPGAHCMARRSFMAAVLFGIVAVVLLQVFTSKPPAPAGTNVIGQISYSIPSPTVGQRRSEGPGEELLLNREYILDAYDAYLWLPTGQDNTYSSLDVQQGAKFRFTESRRIELSLGSISGLDVRSGGISEGPFIVVTPHALIQVEAGALAVSVTRDGAQTQVSVVQGTAQVSGLNSEQVVSVVPGYCTSVERGAVPAPARPMLELKLSQSSGAGTDAGRSEYEFQAMLVNTGFMPVKVARAFSRVPVYLLHVRHAAEYETNRMAENTTLPPVQVTPKPEENESPDQHRGEDWLQPGGEYVFTFDVSPMFLNAPPVEFWLLLEYRGDLYAPAGQAKVKIHSRNLRVSPRQE